MIRSKALLAATLMALSIPGAAPAQELSGAESALENPIINDNGSVNFVDHVGIDQNLGDKIDLELEFLAHDGNPVRLGEVIRRRPAILVLAYYECPMLCTLVLNGLLRSLRSISGLDVGKDFDVLLRQQLKPLQQLLLLLPPLLNLLSIHCYPQQDS